MVTMVEKIALVVVAHMCQFERTYSGTTTLHGLEKLLRTIQPFLAEEPTASNTETDILGNFGFILFLQLFMAHSKILLSTVTQLSQIANSQVFIRDSWVSQQLL